MLIHSLQNQYFGINAHLHSLWQAGKGWRSFHTTHIGDLTKALRLALDPLGYRADVEQSLQIRRADENYRTPQADVTIYDPNVERSKRPYHASPRSGTTNAQEMMLAIPTMLGLEDEEEAFYKAIAIYERHAEGDPVAWIELLSPSNKAGGSSYDTYRRKRETVILAGIVFLEIDYLHESPPTFEGIADYSHKEEGAFPYRITVTDPRPTITEGFGRVWQFSVDAPIPTVPIPLNNSDVLTFDFDAPYQRTFQEMLFGKDVDYRQLPLNFDRYMRDDQRRIVSRLLTILHTYQQSNANLVSEPSPRQFDDLSLSEALERLEAFAS